MIHPLENIEAEQTLLGLMLTDNSTIDMAADRLSREAFVDPLHAESFELIVRDYALGKTVTPVTLKTYFEGTDALEEYGGAKYFGQLTANCGFFPPKPVIDELASLAVRRRMRAGLEVAANACSDLDCALAEIVSHADDAISDKSHDTIHQPTAAEALEELFDSYREQSLGVTCGSIPTLDGLLGEMRPKQLVIGAGRPGMGKTAVAISYALGAAKRGHGVLYVSLEMSSTELAARIASDLCFDDSREDGVPYEALRDGKLNEFQRRKAAEAHSRLKALPLSIVDAGALTTGRLSMLIRRHARKMKAAGHALELVIVDYLQLMHPDKQGRSNYEAVSEVSRNLKAMAKDNGVCLFALAQLSRAVENRPGNRPQLSDLRDSGQIEQDADAVLFLQRDEYYLKAAEPEPGTPERATWEAAMVQAEGKLEFILAKRRNGATGKATGCFYVRFQAVRG